jgi:hypothetical protein
MPTFEFISAIEFRKCLEDDSSELVACFDIGAWKAVLVLAGSIVEAILADYVDYAKGLGTTIPQPIRGNGRANNQAGESSECATPPNLSPKPKRVRVSEFCLNDLISVCDQLNVLTAETLNLTSVVRSYRNLIHPAVMKRRQKAADRGSAVIARELVEIIAREISQAKETHGPTAERIGQKIIADLNSRYQIDHLLKAINATEIDRLVLTVLPRLYFEQTDSSLQSTISHCYRKAFEASANDTRRKAAERFVHVVRSEGDQRILAFEDSFFRAPDMTYLKESDRCIVKGELISSIHTRGDKALPIVLRALQGIGSHLDLDEATQFARFLCWQIIYNAQYGGDAKSCFQEEYLKMREECQVACRSVIDNINSYVPDFMEYGEKELAELAAMIPPTISE